MLHGWTATADLNFATSYTAMRRRFRVVAMDHRGHGRGIQTLRPFRLEDCADDAAALLDALDVEPAIILGYSMGGPIAQLTWRRHPERVAGLVLCATAARFTRDHPRRHLFTAGLIGASLAARATSPLLRNQAMRSYVGRRFSTDERLEWARLQARNHDPALVLQAGAAIATFDSREWLPSVNVPVAVVRTDLDQLVPPHRQDELARLIPGARTIAVAANHVSVFDNPHAIVSGIVEAAVDVAQRICVRAAA